MSTNAQPGSAFLLQSGDGASPEVFTTIGGLKTSSFDLDATAIDVTNQGSGSWKEILSGAGIRSMKFSGSGVFTNSSQEITARTRLMNNTVANYRISDGINTFTGAFKITKLQRAGDYAKEQTYSMSFESAGPITVA